MAAEKQGEVWVVELDWQDNEAGVTLEGDEVHTICKNPLEVATLISQVLADDKPWHVNVTIRKMTEYALHVPD